jgi:hypothetical protein
VAGGISDPDDDVLDPWPPADRRQRSKLVEREQLRLGAVAAADRDP